MAPGSETAAVPSSAARTSPGEPAVPLPPERTEQLYRKLVWLTLFRLVEVTVLLGATALWQWRAEPEPATQWLYRVIGATYALSLGFAFLLRQRRWLRPLAFAHAAVDVGIAASVVAVSGHGESVFVFMFLLAIVNGAILLYRKGALWGAALCILTYVPVYAAGPHRGGARDTLLTLFIHLAAFVATAALSSYLAEQLRRTGESLAQREGDLATITALHESIVQSLGSGLLTMDRSGRVTFLNAAGEQITGLRLGDLAGAPAARWLPPFDDTGGRAETELVNAAGERLCLGYARFPLLTPDRREIGTAVIFQDLTRLRAMELQVQRSQRLADLGSVAAGLAHELRNPLASMAGSIELLKGSPALRDADARLMEIVLREAARLEQLVAAFLAFSRPAPARRERVDLARVMAETLEVFANDPAAARVAVERELSPAIAWCDPDQVRQVLWNLLANAAQAAGGDPARSGRVRLTCGREGAWACFAVWDDGPGIAPSDLKNLFTPFFTTKERGTGLGLATVQRIVDASGGAVSVDSEPGAGTRFGVRLPAAPAA